MSPSSKHPPNIGWESPTLPIKRADQDFADPEIGSFDGCSPCPVFLHCLQFELPFICKCYTSDCLPYRRSVI